MKTKPLDAVQPAQDVAARLATEFDGLLPPELVTRIVVEAICDLYGQVQPKAFPELLHRLAHYRLDIACGRAQASPIASP
ncbi:hypothetical protein [Mycobacterium sp. 155]|uniref:hypothetical protein n=1 Tax=Mycobacterium sp. 155 TaxID=1157943 RepID=UPI0003825594|nr:hypothetical protein [Mycobacterium sp. 155]